MPIHGMNALIVQREPLVALDLKVALEAVGARAVCGTSAESSARAARSGGLQFCIMDDKLWRDGDAAALARLLGLFEIPFMVFGASARQVTGSFANVVKPAPSDSVVAVVSRHFAH